MRSTTATSLRKELFGVIEKAAHFIPTRVRHKKGDTIILSYHQYLALRGKKKRAGSGRLGPLVRGRITGELNERTEKMLLRYMGLK